MHIHRDQCVEITRGPRFGDLAWKITMEDGFPVWASKLEWGPSVARQPGGFPGLVLKTWSGVRCGRTARRVSWFGPQNQGWRPVRPGGQEGFLVWASKPGMAPDAVGWPGGFDGLGLKTIVQEGFPVLTQNRGRRLA